MKVIAELESVARGVYCGAIGYISADDQMQMNIAIRTCVAKDGELSVGAGGGIVIDSVCESEYQESIDKISSFINPLNDYVKSNSKIDKPITA